MNKEILLSPSLLSSDFGRLADELIALEQAGLKWVHWDVMDGAFVPNITMGPPIIKRLRKECSLFFDVHLMIEKPERYLEEFAEAGADLICVHAEASVHLDRTVSVIRDLGVQAGVALNPHTPPNVLEYLLPKLDMALVMSVNPGFGGQSFIPSSVDKIRTLAAMARKQNPSLHIQVDGGVTPDNIAELVTAGADVFVSGSAFFAFPPYQDRHKIFLKAAAKA